MTAIGETQFSYKHIPVPVDALLYPNMTTLHSGIC